MVTFGNDEIQESETRTDWADLDVVNIERLNGSIPFYAISHNGEWYTNKTIHAQHYFTARW
jgi:hypothetical protein